MIYPHAADLAVIPFTFVDDEERSVGDFPLTIDLARPDGALYGGTGIAASVMAMEAATLARLHPGRLHLGLGHGVDEWMRQIGAKPASQLALLEELVIAVRVLLAGEAVSAEGRYVRLRGVQLGHPPRTVPPVSVGVRGPKGLELAGRVADGTVIDSLS